MVILRNLGISRMLHEIGDRKIIFFGAGNSLKDFLEFCGDMLRDCVGFAMDNNKKKDVYEEAGFQIPVYSMEDAKDLSITADKYCMCITSSYYKEIVAQLDESDLFCGMLCYLCWPPLLSQYSRQPIAEDLAKEDMPDCKIPKTIHYCWFGKKELPELEQRCVQSWRECCPDYTILRWDESNYDVHTIPYVSEAYEAGKYSFVSDYARLDVMERYGGIYFDTDLFLLGSVDFLRKYDAFFSFEYLNMIATGLGFGCVAGNELVRDLKAAYQTMHFKDASGNFDMTPCPKLQTPYFEKLGIRIDNTLQYYKNTLFLSSDFFCPMNQYTALYELTCNTLGIHLFSNTWVEGDIKRGWEETKTQAGWLNERLLGDWKRLQYGAI